MASITILILCALVFALAHIESSLAQATSNYVIFGGTQPVVRTRIDPIVNPGTVSE